MIGLLLFRASCHYLKDNCIGDDFPNVHQEHYSYYMPYIRFIDYPLHRYPVMGSQRKRKRKRKLSQTSHGCYIGCHKSLNGGSNSDHLAFFNWENLF